MTAKEFLESIGYEFTDKDFWMEDYLNHHKFKDLIYLMERYAEQKLQQHVVMKAEESDVSEGATVGQRSVGTVIEVWNCKVCGKPFRDKYTRYEHYNTEHNQGAEAPDKE